MRRTLFVVSCIISIILSNQQCFIPTNSSSSNNTPCRMITPGQVIGSLKWLVTPMASCHTALNVGGSYALCQHSQVVQEICVIYIYIPFGRYTCRVDQEHLLFENSSCSMKYILPRYCKKKLSKQSNQNISVSFPHSVPPNSTLIIIDHQSVWLGRLAFSSHKMDSLTKYSFSNIILHLHYTCYHLSGTGSENFPIGYSYWAMHNFLKKGGYVNYNTVAVNGGDVSNAFCFEGISTTVLSLSLMFVLSSLLL